MKLLQIICVPIFLFCLFSDTMVGQKKADYEVVAVGFYNFENLFDLEDTPDKKDEEFLPEGSRRYTKEVYADKLSKLSRVVSELGTDLTADGVAILGICEIETRTVLEDFVKMPKLADRNYQIVHEESPDFRGIDVAFLYNPKYFEYESHHTIPLFACQGDTVKDEKFRSREILFVTGKLNGERVHFSVNHWPSRRGGEQATSYLREMGACMNKVLLDSLNAAQPDSKFIIMGDLNDNPSNSSVKNILRAKKNIEDVKDGGVFNPFWSFFKKGLGTGAWRDAWSLFDQMLISEGYLDKNQDGYFFFKSKVKNDPYLISKSGRYKGYPFRTYSGGEYAGGYSDHFPVVTYLLRMK